MQGEFGITEAHSKVIPLSYYGSCGAGGNDVKITNRDINRKVKVTVEVSSASIPPVQSEIDLNSGEAKVVGCTFVNGDERNYKVVTAVFN